MKVIREKIQVKIENLTRKQEFLVLSIFPTYFFVAGLLVQPLDEILEGILTIIAEPDVLITDYVEIGGPGAALVNASLVTYVCLEIIYLLDMEITGTTLTSLCLMMGFSLFGKNIINIWAILLGVGLYAHYHKESLSHYIYIAFYGTSLSPVVTQVVQYDQLSAGWNLILGVFVSIVIGFVLPPLSVHLYHTHQGYCLYNVGFAAGIIATVIASVFQSFGMESVTRTIWAEGYNRLFLIILMGLFLILIISGLLLEEHPFARYRDILKHTGISGTDYIMEEGTGATFLNMGIDGIFATLFVIAVGADLNGPTIGGILTIVGFSATGKHLRNIVPVMLGVLLASFAGIWNITDPGAILAALFCTTLAPIAGEYGIFWGIVAGFLHASVAQNVSSICGGMNLYNNGFAGGIVAAFLVPVIRSIRKR